MLKCPSSKELKHRISLFQLIHLILENKIQYMSGAAQKYVFNIMEEMVNEGNLTTLLDWLQSLKQFSSMCHIIYL